MACTGIDGERCLRGEVGAEMLPNWWSAALTSFGGTFGRPGRGGAPYSFMRAEARTRGRKGSLARGRTLSGSRRMK